MLYLFIKTISNEDRKKKSWLRQGNTFCGITAVGHKHKVEDWRPWSSKCSPARHTCGTSQIMYSKITFCSCETTGNLTAPVPFGESMTPLKHGKCPNLPQRKMAWSTGKRSSRKQVCWPLVTEGLKLCKTEGRQSLQNKPNVKSSWEITLEKENHDPNAEGDVGPSLFQQSSIVFS